MESKKIIQMNVCTDKNKLIGIENKFIVTKGEREGGVWNKRMYTTVYKIVKQQRFTV